MRVETHGSLGLLCNAGLSIHRGLDRCTTIGFLFPIGELALPRLRPAYNLAAHL
jgi:hypothetical protein